MNVVVDCRRFVRFLAVLLILIAVITFGFIIQANANDLNVHNTSIDYGDELTIIYVDQGDTLWSIAGEFKPKGASISSYIAEIKQVNQLSSSMVVAGQRLKLP